MTIPNPDSIYPNSNIKSMTNVKPTIYSASQDDSLPIVRQITAPSPEEFQQIAKWMYQWWGIAEGYSMEEIHCYLKHGFNTDKFPRTYGLFLGNLLIGCFQFTLNDFELRPDIYPWLANLYIDKNWRGKGYGNILIEGAKSMANKTLPYKHIFLYTEHTGLYEHFGFQFVEEIDTLKKVPRIQRLYKLVLSL